MKKQHWNIWRIKNRWLRAAFCWAILPLMLAFLAVCVVLSLGGAAVEAVKAFGSEFMWLVKPSPTRPILKPYLRGLTAQD